MRRLLAKDQKGQSIIEFAMVLPILLLVVFGITEFGRAIKISNILSAASREGARQYFENSDTGSAQARVDSVLAAADITPKAVYIDTTYAYRSVKVTVTYDFQVLSAKILNFLGPPVWELKGTTVMRN